MPDATARLSGLAEVLLGQLAARATDHRRLTLLDAAGGGASGRHLRRDAQNRDSNALVDFVAVAEWFSTGRLLSLLPPGATPDMGNWHKRARAWKKHASVDPTTFDRWQALMGFVDVRNALQHGLGRLTDQQLRYREQTLAQIGAAGLDLNGDLLIVTGADAETCYETCTAFVRFLDARCPSG